MQLSALSCVHTFGFTFLLACLYLVYINDLACPWGVTNDMYPSFLELGLRLSRAKRIQTKGVDTKATRFRLLVYFTYTSYSVFVHASFL